MSNIHLLTISCIDRPGLVAAVAGFLSSNMCNILELQQFNSVDSGLFFMRVRFEVLDNTRNLDTFRRDFQPLAHAYDFTWRVRDTDERRRVLLMVSKFDHCLSDLLYRYRIGELHMEVTGIVSNHPKAALNLPFLGDIPFHHLPVTRASKAEQEARIQQIVTDTGTELVVLARYMQILSDDMAAFLSGRCINIHHSFLPGFKGARPYHQAHARGVKMIGATAHYVTRDLDEGPIIHQDVEAITHAHTPEQLIQKGRNIEQRVLATAVALHLHDRVFIDGGRTVVFKN